MSDGDEKILEETRRFHAALPELIGTLKGRWVAYRDGEVQGDHLTEEEAYTAALEAFGLDGGFIVARVEELKPAALSASAIFGIP